MISQPQESRASLSCFSEHGWSGWDRDGQNTELDPGVKKWNPAIEHNEKRMINKV